ncbi:imidazoleglycerol phosphate synthase, cyclase subunit [Phytophthora nicotianae CJ01A1]|uniref:Imidazole glycerol phosphate synthase hisHF n=6 Tax=Phytophthora nicotianae TaxID=4792 RepID=W2PHH6_PHYN3|nr:imidazoleglycerol phosphate synthase, cyclase subunit [Phytophthora nicotianae INRA-310]ETI32261.1 imidazoleglycerol phosphate synthase, cyclase subunit [Phytophthora nicotianae P1569]ETK72635.1 imidazoleglycerol phosphate synthase, cyclase subunit [Phytophthora nicotianae]ETO60992.1 imidazoleglycerol phosphate synthase, cyclase subunit [Phytophthora nicotianae P1976]ETP02128.1 imidazoleglycerol phosphate synthase, cyclase subunit [Phytophthora nicotianae CJ01A1]ETP30285.1 imidazoleglycerol
MVEVTVLDYGAGNVRSLKNAIRAAGHSVKDVSCAEDIRNADVLIFPGVGNFRAAMEFLNTSGYVEELKSYIAADRRFMGICLGMQTLFEGSEECPELKGLGIIKGKVARFPSEQVTVPHIGWNGINAWKKSALFASLPVSTEEAMVYFVHSFRATKTDKNADWVLSTTNYGELEFVSAVQKGNVMATQFHPEKSGAVGIAILKGFLENKDLADHDAPIPTAVAAPRTTLSKRIIACLDVRANDQGDLVVTKGDQYDVRETSDSAEGGNVRNMGKPVDLCKRYFEEGADEVAFLNITSFREQPMGDLPMVQVLEASSECVFVPLTIGGGIREYVDDQQKTHSALDVAALYFRSGADKVSIGSDAVYTAEKYYANGGKGDGSSSIETISAVYGNQAVVVSMDPKRVYVASFYDENAKGHNVVKLSQPGPNGEEYCWYQMTVRGGREARDIDVVQLAQAVEALGAGELLLNCVDMDGQKAGYDLDLISLVKKSVRIPVVASSGAGKPEHFTEVFEKTNCDAALAAGIFHRKEVAIQDVKAQLHTDNISVRL